MARIEKAVQAGQQLSQSDEDLLAALLADADGDKGSAKGGAQGKQKIFDDGTDVNNLTPGQIADAVMKAVSGQLSDFKAEFDKRFAKSEQVRFAADVQAEIKEAKAEFKEDFVKNYDKVLQVAKRHPSLTVKEAYLLMKAPGFKELEDKKADDKKREESGRKVVSLPDGLTSEALQESVKGKSILDTAMAIAEQIGFDE